jgi:phosphoesterase RecJ-like protein
MQKKNLKNQEIIMTDNFNIVSQITDKLKRYDNWIILCHESPDGDTVGCGLALYSLGMQLGKNVSICGKNAVPDRYTFLPHSETFEPRGQISIEDVKNALVICVDTSTAERCLPGIDEVVASGAADTINIDHHGDNTKYCGLNLIDSRASATAEIVTGIIKSCWTITKDEAICLYTALSTDNGNFRFSSTTPQSHLCAAELLGTGIDPSYIDDCVNENMNAGILKLWGIAFSRTETFVDGTAALFWLRTDDFAATNTDTSASDGLVNMLLRIKGIKIALILSETNGTNKASIRTRQPYSARDIAAVFGGGGHIQAAGARIAGNFNEALKKLKAETVKYVNRVSSSK